MQEEIQRIHEKLAQSDALAYEELIAETVEENEAMK